MIKKTDISAVTLPKTELSARLEAAKTAARAAGDALMAHYVRRDRLVIDQKGVNDFVSQADREAELIISGILTKAFPQDGFLGEETGLSGPAKAGLVWCVDPLDGTTNFLKGAHNWCVSIGLWFEDYPVLGVILDPLRNEMFSAANGMGAWLGDQPISVSSIASLDMAAIGFGHNRRAPLEQFAASMHKVMQQGAGFRQVGAGALMLAYVAAGRVDGYVEAHMWPWDAVAGLALILEAGGFIGPYLSPGDGLPDGGAVLVANSALYPAIAHAVGRDHPLGEQA